MDTIKVVVCRPKEVASVEDIGTELEDLQYVVDGYIEVIYPFADQNICLVCNDEGKIGGYSPNRALRSGKEIIDVVFGTFFICRDNHGDFESLTDDDIYTYSNMFDLPERIFTIGRNIHAVKYDPTEK